MTTLFIAIALLIACFLLPRLYCFDGSKTRSMKTEEEPLLPIKPSHDIETLASSRLSPDRPTLFLDIDGVLHRNFDESLSHLYMLESFLAKHPTVQIVLSSTWRTTCESEYLENRLGELVWDKLVGFTPILSSREEEVLAFVQHFGIRQYVCLDDDKSDFFGRVPVVFTDCAVGLSYKNIEDIRLRLS